MGAESGFFFNPLMIGELAEWCQSTRENLAIFEPLVRAARILCEVVTDSADSAVEIRLRLEQWCSSAEFEALIMGSYAEGRNIWLGEATKHFSDVTGIRSAVGDVSVDNLLRAFSAIVRSELRAKDSRSTVRLDEMLVWQANFEEMSEHTFGLWLLCNLLEGTNTRFFDQLSELQRKATSIQTNFSADAELDFRPCIVSGISHVAFSRFDEAGDVFAKAISLSNPAEPAGLLGLALTELLRGNRSSAQLLLRNVNCMTPVTHAVRIFVCEGDVVSDLPSLVNQGQSNDLHECTEICTQALAYVLLRRGDYEGGRQALARGIGKESIDSAGSIFTMFLMGEAEFQQARLTQFEDPPVPGAPGNEHVARVGTAKQFYERALETSEQLKLSSCALMALKNLVCVLIVRREFATASTVVDRVLLVDPLCARSIYNRALILLARGLLPDVHEAVCALRGKEAVKAGRLAADAWCHAGDFDQSLELREQLLEHETDRLWRMRHMIRKLEVLRMMRRQKDAQSTTNDLISTFGAEPEMLFSLGCELSQNRQFDQALDLLQEAKRNAAPNLKKWISWELARLFCKQNKILTATDEYAAVADKHFDSVQSREFAVVLYRAGLKSAAYERANLLRMLRGEIIPGISEIEADCLIGTGRVSEARDLLRDLETMRPLSVTNKLAMIQLSIELEDAVSAKKDLSELKRLPVPASAQTLLDELEAKLLTLQSRT